MRFQFLRCTSKLNEEEAILRNPEVLRTSFFYAMLDLEASFRLACRKKALPNGKAF